MKTSFAFLTHPITRQHINSLWPLTRLIPRPMVKTFLKHDSFKIIPLKRIKDIQGNEIDGCVIVSATHLDEIRRIDDEEIFNVIIEAGRLSEKLGFRILGLGGYYSAVADRKSMLYKHMKVPVTTGSAFTAWCVYEGAFKAARKNRLDLSQMTVAILSPANSIGLLCGRKFADHCSRLILSGDRLGKLEKMKQIIQTGSHIQIDTENDPAKAVQEASIVINADPLDSLLPLPAIKSGSIVCDVSISGNIRRKALERPDISFIDCTLVSTPFNGCSRLKLDLPHKTVTSCLAETMLLSFREKFVNYSLGNNINPDKLEYIADVASHHGFEVMLPGAEIT